MSDLRAVPSVKPIYFVPREDLIGEVLIPSLSRAESVDCMVGFFSGQSLSVLAPGLASFIANSSEPMRLIICPVLGRADRDAIAQGYKSPESVVEQFISDGLLVPDALTKHTLRCLAYLISLRRVQMSVAIMKDALFHPKVWLIRCGSDVLAVHGSGNLTVSGLSKNYEQITVDNNWSDENGIFVVNRFRREFEEFWSRTSDVCQIYEFPDAIAKRLLREYSGRAAPTEAELLALIDDQQQIVKSVAREKKPFSIPAGLNYTSGDFEHQGKAAEAFANNGYRGILAMATGSGKTITAMIAAHGLFQREEKLLIVVAAPYLPLIAQWCEEMTEFGLEPRNLSSAPNMRARNQELASASRRLRLTDSPSVEALVVTHNTLCDPTFQAALQRADAPVLLVADEMHNLGREEFISRPPEAIPYRLGLSATPVRQYDQEGTVALEKYFGSTVFAFTLEQAIN
jgi:HKD family nuclease